MATTRRPFGVAEPSKKSDDLKPKGRSGITSLIGSLRAVRRRRIVFGVLALWLLYLFIKNIPTDLPPVSQRYDKFGGQRPSYPGLPPKAGNPSQQRQIETSDQSYDGPIKFYELAASLGMYDFLGPPPNNVLFVLSDVRSASTVAASACAMAFYNTTKVHVAMMGRYDIDLKNLLLLNHIPESECPIVWHNAQPDHSADSSTDRIKMSVQHALGHIHKSLSLHAIFFDESAGEDDFTRSAVRTISDHLAIPAIAVPDRDAWMLSLDSHSLRQWTAVSINIVVRAPSESAGALIRLLRSIQKADYGGLSHPKLTIELPALPDQALLDYIAGYQWPPRTTPSQRRLNVRRKPDPKILGSTAASLSTLESFYPITLQSHVLVLSPDVELSPNYYQLLIYLLLKYKYGSRFSDVSDKLIGIAFEELAQTFSNSGSAVLLGQKANSNAALYFGDKWNELHNYVTLRIQADPEWRKTVDKSDKESTNPAWLRAAGEMMQAQGYFMLHPHVEKGASPMVTVHQELHHSPEEYSASDQSSEVDDLLLQKDGDALVGRKAEARTVLDNPMLSTSSVVSLLDLGDHQAQASVDVPIFDATGRQTTWDDVAKQKSSYADRFASEVGACTSKRKEDEQAGGIERLFCT